MAYLIKVTLVWTIFLVLFELLFKHNGRFTANRIYLLLSIALGLLLPLIPAPSAQALPIANVAQLYSQTQRAAPAAGINIPQDVVQTGIASPATGVAGWGFWQVVLLLYGTGMAVLFVKYLVEFMKIAQLIRKKPVHVLHGHKVICTGKVHSPYTFLGYTFLACMESLSAGELQYIIQHEAAHHTRKHWLDLWLMQIIHLVFWFHPLVWRYRHLLQLQHEYEADAIAAGTDPYMYGRFLLQQTLLRGVPSITHSFHFSPIKNRINMLTKINGIKSSIGKYLLLIPAVLGCSLLVAKTTEKSEGALRGNKISFKGNTLIWQSSDTIFYDRGKGKAEVVTANTTKKPQVIVGLNNEQVYRNDYLQAQASYGSGMDAFADYVKDKFQALRKNTADSLTYITEMSVVVDKEGKVVYYDVKYARDQAVSNQPQMWDVLYSWGSQANVMMDKIIAGSPLWKPAMVEGKAVNSYVSIRIPGC